MSLNRLINIYNDYDFVVLLWYFCKVDHDLLVISITGSCQVVSLMIYGT